SMLPEEFPLVLTVFMVMGAWRISRAMVLTRRAAIIETLGAATVLCTDKTGTLTQNRMSVAALWTPAAGLLPPGEIHPDVRHLLEIAALASERHPSDPMEQAIHAADRQAAGEAPRPGLELVRSYGRRADLLAVVKAWMRPGR